MNKRIFWFFTLFFVWHTTVTFAAIPETISYQGRLTSKDGNPIQNGLYAVTFSFYTTENASTAVWVENQTVETKNGYFSCALGTQTSFASQGVQFHQPYYLGVKVGTEPEMIPRMQLQSVPYAIYAQNHPIITTEKIQDGAIIQAKAPNVIFFEQENMIGEFGTLELTMNDRPNAWSFRKTFSLKRNYKNKPTIIASIAGGDLEGTTVNFLAARADDNRTATIYITCTGNIANGNFSMNWYAFGEKE